MGEICFLFVNGSWSICRIEMDGLADLIGFCYILENTLEAILLTA